MKRQYIDWIKSYLNSSKQYVRYSEGTAPSEQIKYGVPQGSILGPLYFFIFLNDFQDLSIFLWTYAIVPLDSWMLTMMKTLVALIFKVAIKHLNLWSCISRLSLGCFFNNFNMVCEFLIFYCLDTLQITASSETRKMRVKFKVAYMIDVKLFFYGLILL